MTLAICIKDLWLEPNKINDCPTHLSSSEGEAEFVRLIETFYF